jgi:hypothetical protein
VLYSLLSLDGVTEEPSDWMTDFGQPIFDNLARVIGSQDTILFAARPGDDPLRRLDLVDLERTPAGTLLVGYRAADPEA